VHTWSSVAALEEAFLASEVEAMEYLAAGLKLHLESMLAHDEKVESAQGQLAELAQRWDNLDLMVIDEQYRVRAASDPGRTGKRWYEKSIALVMSGKRLMSWNVSDHEHEGRKAVDASVGVVNKQGEVVYVVHIARWLDRLLAAIHSQHRHDVISVIGELLVVAVAVNLLTFLLVLRPLQRIRRQIADSGWLEDHPRLVKRDEILHLGAVVNSMLAQVRMRTERLRSTLGEKESALKEISADRDHLADRVERVRGKLASTEARLKRAERIAVLAQLSGALAHELRNPLHIIRATAETAARRCPDVAGLATDIMDEVDRVNRLIVELLEYTRPSDIHWQGVDLGELLEEVRVRMCRGLCKRDPAHCKVCRIAVDESAANVEADPVLLAQAVMNLFANAREMSPEETEIKIAAGRDDEGYIAISVSDRGSGISDEDQDRVFEPFFTRKGDGTGLGLPTVQKIADLHEGSIELLARAGGGTVACLRLPVKQRRGEA
jgi:signal transduction histidine kinase